MLKHKNGLILIFLVIFIILLTACDYYYDLYHEYIREETEVTSVELIYYNNPTVKDNPLEIYPFDLEQLEILEALNIDKIDCFLIEIENIGGFSSKLKEKLKSPNGDGIKLTYDDNGFTLITVTVINDIKIIFVGDYDADENIEGFYGISWPEMIDDFKFLINKYFITQIEWED